jgi:hypothetical protein
MSVSKDFLKNIDLEKCHWADNKVKCFEFFKFEKYKNFMTYTHQFNQNILLRSIVGTAHPDYGDKETWLSMLFNGKRMEKNLSQYLENPKFYENPNRPGKLSYCTLNGSDLYYIENGNHRSTIAKFIFAKAPDKYIEGVDVTHYTIKFDFYDS